MSDHDWIPSTLGHGETMCRVCLVTNREAEALGMAECPGETRAPVSLESEWVADIRAGRCPDCGAPGRLVHGPRGGASVNLRCGNCGAKWNAGGAAYGLRAVFFVQRIGEATEPDRCGRKKAREAYHDPACKPRACDRCGARYTGPAVYCSLACAECDAIPWK